MANVTNPQGIKFCNEQLRPLCEAARALAAQVDAMSVDWYAGINGLFESNNQTDLVEDGREAEGVSRLHTADVVNAVANLLASAAALNAEIIALPCVRPLRVTE